MPIIGDRPDFNLNAVVYATDFSLGSQNAGLYASLFAGYFSAKLFVTHAFILSQAAMEVEIDHSLVSQQRKDLDFLLSRKASLLAHHGSPDAIPTLLEGRPGDVIRKLADTQAPSLIVLGTHGGGWIERGIIGSVAENLLRSTRWPVLTVGPQVPAATSSTLPLKRILYATDFSPEASHAAVYALSLAEAFGSEIDVLNVIQEDDVKHPDRLSELEKQFYTALEALVPKQARDFCDPRTFIAVGTAHEQILEHIKERSVGLLVLGIRRVSHLGMGHKTSGAFQLIVNAACPVLTITG